ncbi:MAG: NAD(P)/FAD-dependent oxidoreductase [Anaerovoracaceae bacterium]
MKLDLSEGLDAIPEKIRKKLRRKDLEIEDPELIRLSIDARHKDHICRVCTVDFSADAKLDLREAPDMSYHQVESGSETMRHRPVVVGFGPCGMFCALELAYRGYRPIVIERGGTVEERDRAVALLWKDGVLDANCNVQFGEGGAGTYSDGKLNSGISDHRKRFILEEFVKAGAQPEILYEQKPHIGTDVLKKVVRNIREKIIELGGEIRFDTLMDEIDVYDGEVHSVSLTSVKQGDEDAGRTEELPAENVILAIGHSSRDTITMLMDTGLEMEAKPFSIGLRIEHDQSLIDRAMYGKEGSELGLPPASYNLSYKCSNGRGVYTFCMCPGGHVIPAISQMGMTVTNGMSNSRRDSGRANSAVLVDVRPEDFEDMGGILGGMHFQEKYERQAFRNAGGYVPPQTTWKELRDGTGDSKKVSECLPDFAVDSIKEAMPEFGKKIRGFDNDDAVLYAVETRSSSPVRVLRGDDMMSAVKGVYPGGEGAGYAGGIMSSACDGLKIAEKIIEKYRPFDDR